MSAQSGDRSLVQCVIQSQVGKGVEGEMVGLWGWGWGEKPILLANEVDWGSSKASFQLSAGDRSQTLSDWGRRGRGVRTACQLLFGVVL